MSENTSLWETLADRAIAGEPISREEARAVLNAPDSEFLALVDAASRVRRHYHGNKVQIHILENAKMGGCSEDCGFCSQSARYETNVPAVPALAVAELVEGARKAKASSAWRYCMVTATRGPSGQDLDVICEAARQIKSEMDISLCASLGLLNEAKAQRLAEAGIDRFNHNLETSERHFGNVVTTHTYQDRVSTLKHAKDAGMETCCGGILGLGEGHDDILDLAFSLRELDVDSAPVNFLNPRPGTPMEGYTQLSPREAIKALCMFRFVLPSKDLRAAGGREVVLRSLQPLSILVADSIFANGYLTTDGAGESSDYQMIRDMGYEIEVVGMESPEEEYSIGGGAPAEARA